MATEESIRDVALDLQGKSVDSAPIDTGDLRISGYTSFLKQRNEFTAEVGFNTVYAVRQHEDLTYRHPQGGKAKYLEDPLKENLDRYVQHIRKKVRV